MICVIFALVYNLKLCISDTPFNIAFKIKIHFDHKLILCHVYYAFMPSITNK
jgi:hypothetical protein